MRLDFGLDLVVLISEKKSLGVFVSSHLSHFIIEMSHRKLEISIVLQTNRIVFMYIFVYVCVLTIMCVREHVYVYAGLS